MNCLTGKTGWTPSFSWRRSAEPSPRERSVPLDYFLLLAGIVIPLCILLNRFAERLPIPSLLIFIALGMVFGVDGPLGIAFDDYALSQQVCTVALVFVMFYGGFGTNLAAARPVLTRSAVLSTAGVALTAGLVGVFVHFALGLGWAEALLIGSVISSTDAASVFNLLRAQKLDLKDHTASLLELESGSNDPMSYMLTLFMVSLLTGQSMSMPLMLLRQVGLGILCGFAIGWAAVFLLTRFNFHMEQGKTIFVFAVALLAYALPAVLGGNGYLSVYLCGIWMGNHYLPEKRVLVHFFDAVTGVAQMSIFFLLGLLVTPSQLPAVLLPALLIMAFLTLVGRPVAVSVLLAPFRSSLNQVALVSWAGLRGVASIVFAIFAVTSHAPLTYNLFNLVFCIVLLSMALQGSLLPWVSRKLNMIDHTASVSRTFNDYQATSDVSFVKIHVDADHALAHRALKDTELSADFLVTLILRDGSHLVPNGDTVIQPGDLLILAAHSFDDRDNLTLYERRITGGDSWRDHALKDISLPAGTLVVMIQREDDTLIPGGNTVIQADDTVVLARF